MAESKLLAVTVRDRDGVVFVGQATAVSGYNSRGVFDVLPTHANFISILRRKLVIKKADGTREEFKVDSGLIQVTTDKVQVYLGV